MTQRKFCNTNIEVTRMSRLMMILFLLSFESYSQKILFKEYIHENGKQKTLISELCQSSLNQIICNDLNNIWKFDSGRFYTISGKYVLIINQNCEKVDSILFNQDVIDLSVAGSSLIVSTTDDEVEYYESKLFSVNLKTKVQRELGINNIGVKFGLNISQDEKSLSYIHQDETNSFQRLMIYKLVEDNFIEIERHLLELRRFGEIGDPAKSFWLKDKLYFAIYSSDYVDKSIFLYNEKKSEKKKVSDLAKDYGLVFKVSKDGNNIILFKKEKFRSKQIVLLNTHNGYEKVLYISGKNTLSDLDDFAYVE